MPRRPPTRIIETIVRPIDAFARSASGRPLKAEPNPGTIRIMEFVPQRELGGGPWSEQYWLVTALSTEDHTDFELLHHALQSRDRVAMGIVVGAKPGACGVVLVPIHGGFALHGVGRNQATGPFERLFSQRQMTVRVDNWSSRISPENPPRTMKDTLPTLAAFDEQMRRRAKPNHPGSRAEMDGPIVRWVNPEVDRECTVLWSDLDAANADAIIAAQARDFAALGRSFEWKYHAHDRPGDLPARLRAAGFEEGEPEAVMVASVSELTTDAAAPNVPDLPEGVRLEPALDAAGIARLASLHDEVFGARPGFGEALLAQLQAAPDTLVPIVALAGDRPVCAARIEFHRGTEFATLWGGGTLPEWRGRGLYRALVAYRARLAAERGVRYLHVDASPQSRPILERLGFVQLTTTIPFSK